MRIFGALLPGSCRVAVVHSLDSRQTRVDSGPVTPVVVVHGYMLYSSYGLSRILAMIKILLILNST